MAIAQMLDEAKRRRQAVPGLQAPADAAPAPTASPAVPSYSAPQPLTGGTQTDAGWQYDWRPEPYQNQLGAGEIADQKAEYAYRAAHPNDRLAADGLSIKNAIAQSQSGGGTGASRTGFDFGNMPGFQFDDPYTMQLEDLIKQNLTAIQQPQANPALDQLTAFLNKQFTDLSTSPGYSPEELAILRTQFSEPIERDRAANRDRVLQRTASRGMLPSSGLHEQDLQQFVDQPAMEARTAAQRDLAINAIGQRRADLNQAAQFGKTAGIDIPGLQRAEDQGRRAEALNLSSLLYDLPNRAQQQAANVVNGSPGPQDLFSQSIQLQQAQQQQQALNAQKWTQIGQLIAGLF